MTTPAQNVDTAFSGVQHWLIIHNNGRRETFDQVFAAGRLVRVRPKSVNNPLRRDHTRSPSNWTSQGGLTRGVNGYAQFRDPSRSILVTGLVLPAPQPTGGLLPIFPEGDGNAVALRKALAQFADSELDFGVALREVKETAGLATQYYQAASRAVSSLHSSLSRSGSLRQQMRDFLSKHSAEWKGIPSRYLEYLYGMKPFADELANAVDLLTDCRDREYGFKLTLRAKTRFHDLRERDDAGGVYTYSAVWKMNVTQMHRASLVFQLPSWYWDKLPPVTAFSEAWQVTRLSFLADWVLPIGQWLRGFEGFQLRPFFQEGSVSMFLSRRYSGVELRRGTGLVSASLPISRSSDYSFRRTKLVTFPGELLFRPPRLRSTLGIDKLDQASALLGQRLAKLAQEVGRR